MSYRCGWCHFRAHPEERCSHQLTKISSVEHLGWLNSALKNVEDDCDCINLSPESWIYLWVVYNENKVMVCVSGSSNCHGIELLFLGKFLVVTRHQTILGLLLGVVIWGCVGARLPGSSVEPSYRRSLLRSVCLSAWDPHSQRSFMVRSIHTEELWGVVF